MTVETASSSGAMQSALVGQILDSRWRVVKKLGEGGMGEVYAVEHIHIEKRRAMKLLRPEIVSNKEAVDRFRQEARSSSSIGHRNIIEIEDFGELPQGGIYMLMELLNGAPLNDMITQPMPVDRLLNILIQTGHGLAAAHAKNIVHRDMKPENIFVTIGPNGEDIPKILDFGIAKVSGNEGQNHLTRTGTIFGTPFYMAPEQALGNPVDQRTDIYAVGVIAYEVFAGSLPFQGESFMGILTQHITTEPEPVAQRAAKVGRTLPNGLAEVVTRCMRKNPAERFQSMDELVNALIAVYRGIAGAGMSTYMEAFGGQQGVHPAATPGSLGFTGQGGVMQGGVMSGGVMPTQMPGMPTPAGGMRPPTYQTGPGSGPHVPTGQGAVLVAPSGSAPAYGGAPGTVGTTSHAAPASKSKLPLIIVLIVLILGGGAVAAVLVLNQKSNPVADKGPKKDHDDKGSASIGTGSGSSSIGQTIGSQQIETPGSNTAQHDVGSGLLGSNTTATDGSAGSAADQGTEVAISSKPPAAFELWEDGKRIVDPDNDNSDNVQMVPVVKGKPRNLVVKAKGYYDAKVTVAGDKNIVHVQLTRIPNATPPPLPHPTPTPTPNPDTTKTTATPTPHPRPNQVDCHDSIKNPKNRHCVAQYCVAHEKDPICDLE